MKKKLVMKVQMNCQKCRIKAMEVAAVAEGVDSVAFEGKEKELVAVTGESIDPANLVAQMRKKVGHTELVSFSEVKPKVEEKPKPPPFHYGCPQLVSYGVVVDQDPPGPCSIM